MLIGVNGNVSDVTTGKRLYGVDGSYEAFGGHIPSTESLKKNNGTQINRRMLVTINRNVYNVTKRKDFYGSGELHDAFGGTDASRELATFFIAAEVDGYEDLSYLSNHSVNTSHISKKNTYSNEEDMSAAGEKKKDD